MHEFYDVNLYRKWNRRVGLWVLLAVLVLGVLEWRFFIVERAIGHYLVWNNLGREELGPQWEKANSRIVAGSRLENIAFERRQSERKLEGVRTFGQALELLTENRRLELAPEHFERVYNSLPFYLKPLILAPDSLIYLGANGLLANTLWMQNVTFLEIYFLGHGNEVLSKATLDKEQIDMILRHGRQENVNIDAEPRFSVIRAFSLPGFLQKIDRLDYATRQNFLQAMPAIFEFARPATRIAISNKLADNLVEVAVATDNFRAFIYYLPEEWINDLVSVLDDEDFRRDENEDFL
jgi:hypothetical protein